MLHCESAEDHPIHYSIVNCICFTSGEGCEEGEINKFEFNKNFNIDWVSNMSSSRNGRQLMKAFYNANGMANNNQNDNYFAGFDNGDQNPEFSLDFLGSDLYYLKEFRAQFWSELGAQDFTITFFLNNAIVDEEVGIISA